MPDKKQTTTTSSTFTPLFDELVDQGFSLAERVVYGQIWRYSQMSEGCCTASVEMLAQKGGIGLRTATRALARLKGCGLVVDLTPGLKNRTHCLVVRLGGSPGCATGVDDGGTPVSVPRVDTQVDPYGSASGMPEWQGTLSNCHAETAQDPVKMAEYPANLADYPAKMTDYSAKMADEDTIKETLQETKLKKESHHHADERFFSENQWLAAEINAWFEEGDPGSERTILNLLKQYDHSLIHQGREINGREIVVEIFEWALQRPGMTLRKALGCVQKNIATWHLERRYKFANGEIYRLKPEAGAPGQEVAPDTPFGAMQAMVEKVTGYPQTPKDYEALNYFVESGVTLEDLCAAVAFFQERGRQAYGAAQLLNSVKFQVARRTQKEYAQEAQPRPMRTLRDVNGKEIQVPA